MGTRRPGRTAGGEHGLPGAGPGSPRSSGSSRLGVLLAPRCPDTQPRGAGEIAEALKGGQRRRRTAAAPSAPLPPQPGHVLSCFPPPSPPRLVRAGRSGPGMNPSRQRHPWVQAGILGGERTRSPHSEMILANTVTRGSAHTDPDSLSRRAASRASCRLLRWCLPSSNTPRFSLCERAVFAS